MEKKKLPQEFEILELFLVKAGNDFKRTFIGQIKRETTKEGKSIVRGNAVVNDGKIWSCAESQDELGKCLDDLCSMKLDYSLNVKTEIFKIIAEADFFLN
jgi:hypothetical protein